jgi:Holliday junction resolvasome RuvABC endonuclease subunit
MRIILKLSLQK